MWRFVRHHAHVHGNGCLWQQCDGIQTITQQDTTAPDLTVAADVTIECDEDVPAPSYTADDICGGVSVEVQKKSSKVTARKK